MNSLQQHWQRVLVILKTGYQEHAAQPITVSPTWQWAVMRAVRQLGALTAESNPLVYWNQVTWRFATITGSLAIMLSVYLLITNSGSGAEIINQTLDNPVGFLMLQALGGY
jgi:hypothetical protein